MSNKPTTITIDDVQYVRADSIKTPIPTGPIKIFVLDRGFVYVGRLQDNSDGTCPLLNPQGFLVLHNAHNIRYWGTQNGLGELVNGPLKDTKLDPVGVVSIPERALIHIIEVSQSSWQKLGI